MELHSLLGQQPGSAAIDSVLKEVTKKTTGTNSKVSEPTIKIYKDAVYYSYTPLGISFNYEPLKPIVPTEYSPSKNTAPDPALLRLVAIHLYRHPTDKFETFPLPFIIPRTRREDATVIAEMIEMDMTKKAHEVVQLLGEPEERVGGGRQGNCWIGYQRAIGVAVDFVGSNWDDREMGVSSLTLTQPEKASV